ncbi:MAG TPA: trans-aconitate 2-methyltransferase [Micromonosporaceae bacterium]|nr:trans-aconitate 2-methyltransferase [Micromonosporaceae bacterium]
MWDPTAYLRYQDERSRPFYDLLSRVQADQPRTVVDLGCGPGNLTVALAQRWPDAAITGIDSSAQMIATASALGSGVAFTVGDVRDWLPDAETDVVVCNAVLQWVPDHTPLLVRWARALPGGAWLAFQVPGNFDAPSHRALWAIAADPRWRDRLALRSDPVLDACGYAALLADAGCVVDAWETSYVHLLPKREGLDHPVLKWMEGTALRAVRAALDDAEWADFRTALAERLAEAYPARAGQIYFPFRRIFVVARTGARY